MAPKCWFVFQRFISRLFTYIVESSKTSLVLYIRDMDLVVVHVHNTLVYPPNFKARIMGKCNSKSNGSLIKENGIDNGTPRNKFANNCHLHGGKLENSRQEDTIEEICIDGKDESDENILQDSPSPCERNQVMKSYQKTNSHAIIDWPKNKTNSSLSSAKGLKKLTVSVLYSHRTLRRMCRAMRVKMRVPPPQTQTTNCTDNNNCVKSVSDSENSTKPPSPPVKNDEDSDESSEEYEIEDIVDYSLEKGVHWYLVKWKNWSSDHNTWEPKNHLDGCENLVEAFHASKLNRKRKSPFLSEEFNSKKRKMSNFISDLCKKSSNPDIAVMLKLANITLNKFSHTKKELSKLKSSIRDKYVTCDCNDQNKNLRKLFEEENDLFGECGLIEYVTKRKEVLQKLKSWEVEMNSFYGNSCIVVENFVDLEGPPRDFTYITSYIPGEGVEIPDDPLVGCQCSDCLENHKECCPGGAGARFAYYKNGLVCVPAGSPIYECNKLCACGPDCPNRIVQRGQKINVIIFRTDDGRGWGVKTMEKIKKGTFVMEYNGEVITNEEAEKRGTLYDGEGRTYLFDLDYDGSDTFTVDAAFYGNAAHFINHSCDPNLHVYGVWVDHLDTRIPRVAFFARHDIKKYEELTFDYRMTTGSQSPRKASQDPTSSSTEHSDLGASSSSRNVYRIKPIQCKCKSSNCRQFLF